MCPNRRTRTSIARNWRTLLVYSRLCAQKNWASGIVRFLILLLVPGVVQAQQVGSEALQSSAAYQGETVTAVDLVANPHLNLDPLQSLVVQKAGQPYSEQQVRASIAALENTHQFTGIRTLVTPEPKGLALIFVLEPAYSIGIIEFPEAARRFDYIRLLQVVNFASAFSSETPFDKSRLPAAESALQTFLKQNGYFRAQVHTETQVDDANRLVNIIFRAEMGEQARIGRIEIQGTTTRETARLLHSVQSLRAHFTGGLLKTGKHYSEERVKEAIRLMKRSLSGQNYLAGKIDLQPPSYNMQTNRVDLAFHVDTGPIVQIRITGARLTFIPFLSGREARKLIPIYSEGVVDRELVNEGHDNLVDYFQKKGYFDAKVQTTFNRQPDKISLTYAIDRGQKYKVSEISFQGNQALSAANLLSHIPVKKTHVWAHGTFSAQLLKTSISNIEALFQNAGYENVKVSSQIAQQERKLRIIFKVTQGPRTTVNKITVTGNKNISYEELAKTPGFQLQPGGPFSPGKLASDRNQIIATYIDHGYPRVEVKTQLQRQADDPHQLDVVYAVTENQMVRIRAVLYEGQHHTRMWLLKRTANLKPEAPLNQKQLLQSETQLYNLQIFDWASVEPKKTVMDQTQEDAMVRVHEAKRNEVNYGFGFEIERKGGTVPSGTVAVPGLPPVSVGKYQIAPSQGTYASPRGSIEFVRRNMLGLGQTVSFSALAYILDQRAVASYTDPHLIGTNWTGLVSLSYERNTENPLFGAKLSIGSAQLERSIGKKTGTSLQLRYDFNHTSLTDLLVPALVLPQDRNVRLSTVSAAFIRDTRDNPLDAHKGSFTTVNLGVTPTAFGSSANFAKIFAQHAIYKPILGMIWANSIRLGFAKAFSNSFVPTSQLFFAGGGTTLRGFPLDEAGPTRKVPFCNVLTGTSQCVDIAVPFGGRQLFVYNSEIRFPLKMITQSLGGVIFYDGGNVYGAINFNQLKNNYTNNIGIGLRYSTPIGPVRIDLGRNVNPVPGIGATQYFITIGQAF